MPTKAVLGAISYDDRVLIKRHEYTVQRNSEALQDRRDHNRKYCDDQQILNRGCSGFIIRKTCQQFLHGITARLYPSGVVCTGDFSLKSIPQFYVDAGLEWLRSN